MIVPEEFDLSPPGRGFTMRGWDFSREEIASAIRDHRMLNPAIELASNACPHSCFFCFTEDPRNLEGRKRRLRHEMPVEQRLDLIRQARDLGARSINIVGAGEPTIDPSFWTLVEECHRLGVVPIVYTEGALRLTDPEFASRLFDLDATVVLKVNSLRDREYQNKIVEGLGKKAVSDYFGLRNRALEVLISAGFNSTDTTRLAFDTIICEQNETEIEDIHRYARSNNIFVLFVAYLPSGRSGSEVQDALPRERHFEIFDRLAEIDRTEYGIAHSAQYPYAGGVPCSIRGLGLSVKIQGAVFDCPGESELLGDVTKEPLSAIWERARSITARFDGGCAPRELFWSGEHRNCLAERG